MPTKKSTGDGTKEGAGKTVAKSKPAKAASAKQPAASSKTKAAPTKTKKVSQSGDPATYTKPELREKLKEKIKKEDKGGKPGQWSARKAQLLASEYEKEGGGYKKEGRTSEQKHLKSWTEEKWQTADGEKAIKGKTTARYLPKEAWDKMTPAQKKATDDKKKTASRTGKQFVANTDAAKSARKSATKK